MKRIHPKDQENVGQNTAPFTVDEWNDKKSIIQKSHPELTDEDLYYEEGKYSELWNRIQIRFDEIQDKAKIFH